MKRYNDLNPACPAERAEEAKRQAEREEQAMQTPVVTQNTPDDTPAGSGPIIPSGCGEAPTRQELEQDVVVTNPSVESMQSRG